MLVILGSNIDVVKIECCSRLLCVNGKGKSFPRVQTFVIKITSDLEFGNEVDL